MTDQYAVFGNPIAQSLSPQIHTAFAAQTHQQLEYRRELVELDKFAKTAEAFFASGGKGLNITAPFKQDAYSFAARTSRRARRAGAVNTLALQVDGTVLGDTTDGVGLLRDLADNLQWQVKTRRVLMLGAGGAARGVLEALLEAQPQHVVIANRTIEKALQLSKAFADLGYTLGCGFDMLDGQQFDLVINATSTGLQDSLPPLPDSILGSGCQCYEMVYGATATPFMRWAKTRGAEVSDGLGMLVEQAAESFYIWRQVRPDTAPVLTQLRASLQAAR